LLTPDEPEHIAGILAFKHPMAEEVHAKLHAKNVHVMSHAGRLRIAIHGYNTADDIEKLLKELKAAIK
jgi:cysteine desulfurase/selenocysteine lyase